MVELGADYQFESRKCIMFLGKEFDYFDDKGVRRSTRWAVVHHATAVFSEWGRAF